MSAGNLLISAGIVVAGTSATKVLRVLQHNRVATIGNMRTFSRHQARFLKPSVMRAWASQQADMIGKLTDSGRLLCMGGDGKADSPGHSAKYSTYTVMDLNGNKVLDLQLVQVHQKHP